MKDNERIPPVPGPTLGPFQHPLKDRLELLDLLSDPDSEGAASGNGGHGHVFRARFGKEIFAIKIFKFFHIQELRAMTVRQNHYVDDKTLRYHSDPFYAECRAYGKIEEIEKRMGRKTPIVVPCYGYLEIPADPYEDLIKAEFGVTSWDRPDRDRDKELWKRRPFRALVKKLVTDTKVIKWPSRMLVHLELLRGGGVYPLDLYERNYLGGLLVDLSFAWTEPHWSLQYLPEPARSTRRDVDIGNFNRMMKRNNITTVRRAGVPYRRNSQANSRRKGEDSQRSEETMKKLRARPGR